MSLLAILATHAEGDPTTPGTDPALLTRLRTIATGGYSWRGATTIENIRTYVSGPHKVRSPARNLRVAWGRGSGSMSNTYPTLKASIEVRGIVYPVTWDGDRTLVTSAAKPSAISDPVAVQVAPGDIIHVRSTWPAGANVGAYGATDLHKSGTAGGDLSAGGPMTLGQLSPVAPLAILGDTLPDDRKAILILGDSFIEAGWARQAIDALGYAWSDLGTWLEIVPRDRAQLANRLPATGTWAYDTALAFHSGNDSGGTTEAQQALHIGVWRMYRDAGVSKVYGLTIHPYSTGPWTSVAAQSTNTGRNIHGFNQWVRDGAPIDPDTLAPVAAGGGGVRFGQPGHPAHGFFDVHAATAVSTEGPSVWRVGDGTQTEGAAWTVDGAHLSSHGSAMLKLAMDQWLATVDLTA